MWGAEGPKGFGLLRLHPNYVMKKSKGVSISKEFPRQRGIFMGKIFLTSAKNFKTGGGI